MILCDTDLIALKPVEPFDAALVNPASIDIRIGDYLLFEGIDGTWVRYPLYERSKEDPFWLEPHAFILAETHERLRVPNGYAIELRLKSSLARIGLNHSLAFWFDPGWDGIGTMELQNIAKRPIPLWSSRPIAQIIVHKLSGFAAKPYTGKYQHADTVQVSQEIA